MSKGKRYTLEIASDEIRLINLDCGMLETVRCTDGRAGELLKHIVILAKKGLLDCEDLTEAAL